jgi:hypothetical protein
MQPFSPETIANPEIATAAIEIACALAMLSTAPHEEKVRLVNFFLINTFGHDGSYSNNIKLELGLKRPDLPWKFHPVAFRVSGSCMPDWAV